MAPSELAHLGDATSLVIERIVAPVQAMHGVITDRVFKYVGTPGRPVKVVHDAMVGGVYQAIRRTAGAIGTGAGAVMAGRTPGGSVSESRTGSSIQAALNALWGDRLDADESSLAVSLSVRDGDRAVPVDRASLAAAFPAATPHIVVLLHGLGQTERCWQTSPVDASIHDVLANRTGATCLPIRYNSGLPVARSGVELADILEKVCAGWPVGVARISLVGYSMGGLVARAAYTAGVAGGHCWIARLQDLTTVGAPHQGSPIARGVRLGSWALGLAKTSRPLADLLETASAGIKDLREGAGIDRAFEHTQSASPDRSQVRQHFVAAVVTGDVRHPVGLLLGDLVVRVASATGSATAAENVRVLPRRRHFDILSDPDVVRQIAEWLAGD